VICLPHILIWSAAFISHGLGLVLSSMVLRSHLRQCVSVADGLMPLLAPPLKVGQAFSLQLDGWPWSPFL
jgi:hypothetical protein